MVLAESEWTKVKKENCGTTGIIPRNYYVHLDEQMDRLTFALEDIIFATYEYKELITFLINSTPGRCPSFWLFFVWRLLFDAIFQKLWAPGTFLLGTTKGTDLSFPVEHILLVATDQIVWALF